MDDVLLFKGSLNKSPNKEYFNPNRNINNSTSSSTSSSRHDDDKRTWRDTDGQLDLAQVILFTNDSDITAREVSHCVV